MKGKSRLKPGLRTKAERRVDEMDGSGRDGRNGRWLQVRVGRFDCRESRAFGLVLWMGFHKFGLGWFYRIDSRYGWWSWRSWRHRECWFWKRGWWHLRVWRLAICHATESWVGHGHDGEEEENGSDNGFGDDPDCVTVWKNREYCPLANTRGEEGMEAGR